MLITSQLIGFAGQLRTNMTIGIYCLRFVGTDKVYIGQCSTDIEKIRYRQHLATFKNGKAAKKLLSAYLEFGIPTIEVLCECTIDELDRAEEEAIEIFDSVINGFNTLTSATDSPNTGVGALSSNSKYTNDQILEVFYKLVNTPEKSTSTIYKETGVSIFVINDISNLRSHAWLKEAYPEKYLILENTNRSKNSGNYNSYKGADNSNSKYSSEQIIEAFNLLVSTCNTFKEIERITKVSTGMIAQIACLHSHGWLKEAFPEKYNILESSPSRKSAAGKGIVYPPIISPQGTVYTVENIREFSRTHALDNGHLGKVLNRKSMSHKGWKLVC